MKLRRFVFSLVVGLAMSGVAHAQGTAISLGDAQTDPDAPVEVTSEKLSVNRDTGEAFFEGDVLVTQGALKLTADQVAVTYGSDDPDIADGVREVVATGNVVVVNGEDAAESQNAIFNALTNRVTMTGEVLLTQGAALVAGDRLVVDLTTGVGTMEGRVRTVIQSGQDQ